MTEHREFAPAASATTSACAQYLMRSAVDATQFAWRFHQLLGALSRGQLSLQQVEAAIDDAAGWSSAEQSTTQAIDAFATSLAHLPLFPGAASLPDADSTTPDTDVPSDAHRAQLDQFIALLTSLAEPAVTNGARRRSLTRASLADVNATLGSAATAWFGLLDAMTRTSMHAINPALLAALRVAQPRGYDRNVIELEGALATHASTRLEIENTLGRPASLRCTCGEVRRADGIGPAFIPSVTLSPEHQMLDANAQGEVAVSVWLDATQFDEPAHYVGALCVVSDGGSTIDIPLRITTAPAHP